MAQIGSTDAEIRIGLRHKLEFRGDESAPLIIFVHGRAGSVDVMWLFRRCVPSDWNIVAFEAPDSDPIGGFSWWPVGTGKRSPGEIEDAWQLVRKGIDEFIDFYALSPEARLAFGFSQGAGLLALGIQHEPEFLAGLGILAGFVPREPRVEEIGESEIRTRILWAHGSGDEVVPLARARADLDYLKGLGFQAEMVEDEIGHKVGRQGMARLTEWLAQLSLTLT